MMRRMTDSTAAQTEPAFGVVESITKYVAAEGGSAKAVLQPAGAAGVRITLVGEQDGELADRVVPTLDEARRIVDGIEGLEVAEWDRDLTAKAAVTPSHWRQMAGWVAGSHRFPKSRNRGIVDYR